MKIAHVIATFYPRQGGMGVVVFAEANELVERGHSVTVFTMRYGNDVIIDIKDNINIQRVQPVVRLGDGGVVWFGDRFKDFDIIHLHLPWYGSAWLAYLAISSTYVVTLHMEGQLSGFKKIFKKVGEQLFLKTILRNAKMVFVVNKDYFAKSRYLKSVPIEKVVELPNPIDTNLFSPGPANRSVFDGLPPKADQPWAGACNRVILFVGNLLPVKRLDLLLRAVSEGDVGWRLAVVGGGYAEDEYKKMVVDLGVSDKVKFFGSVERVKLPEFYRSADCVVVPSDSESFSLVGSEALACGTQVIVSNVPGAGSLIASGAVGFAPGNVGDLAQKIKNILENKTKSVFKKQFGLKEHVDVLEKFY